MLACFKNLQVRKLQFYITELTTSSRNTDQVYLKNAHYYSAMSCKPTPVQFCRPYATALKNTNVPAEHILWLQPRQHSELCLLRGQKSSLQAPSRLGFETTRRPPPPSRYHLLTTLLTQLHVCVDCAKYADWKQSRRKC